MSIDIDPLCDAAGLTITDHIENTQFELYTDRQVVPRPSPKEDHYFPVDASVTVETGSVEIPRVAIVETRSRDGTLAARGDSYTMPSGAYHLGIDPAPTKLYLRFDSGFTVVNTDQITRVELDDAVDVSLGFRSLHQAPAGTITTPTDPESLMQAVSLLGSALQTTSPERSFPTLRGHPPLIEPGDEFRIPERVDPPDSGVRIIVPPTYKSLYPVVPLAYYFAAEVVPGSPARIEGDGWTHSLEPDLERRAAEALRQSFHFDCIARTEGFYPVDLHEREATNLDLDWAALYDAPLAERLGDYLSVPFEQVEPELPQWTLTTDVRPDPENIESLPFVASELSIVRSPETVTPATATANDGLSFFRSPAPQTAELFRGDTNASTRSGSRDTEPTGDRGAALDSAEFVQPEEVDTVEHAWVGDGVPLDANKATLDAYHRRLETGAVEQSRISVLVVCNDEQMAEEDEVSELYGLRDMVQFDIEVRHDLSRAEMRETLASDVDFLHYIGHVDDRGMQCSDDYLDLTQEDLEVGVSAFLLNACQSYKQGEALIHRGSRGGIVTLSDVANSPATQLGRIIARLMNSGFNLRTALHVAKRELITGHQYIVVGDGGATICQSRSGGAIVTSVENNSENLWNVSAEFFPNGHHDVGSLVTLNLDIIDMNYYMPASINCSAVTSTELESLFNLEMAPVFYRDELVWSDEFEIN